MSDDYSALEAEFNGEIKGYGSLSLELSDDLADESANIGFHIRPEDIEALYFEGIGIPRWESIEADSTEKQLEIYNEAMSKLMAQYPLIQRVNDTDVKVAYQPEEISALQTECERVMAATSDAKATKALQKFIIACQKASAHQSELRLIPT
ncbi:hypothetical protein BH10ACI1_BH10ACI1_16060 [soil metagenome]